MPRSSIYDQQLPLPPEPDLDKMPIVTAISSNLPRSTAGIGGNSATDRLKSGR